MTDPTPLFRPQAIEAQRQTLEGAVAVRTPGRLQWMGVAALLILLAIIALVTWGEYSRKQVALGQVVTSGGLARIAVREPGILVELPVSEGQQVAAGQVLARLRRGLDLEDGRSVDRDRVAHVRENLAALAARVEREKEIADGELAQLRQRETSLVQRLADSERHLLTQSEKLSIDEQRLQTLLGLQARGTVARAQVDEMQQLTLATRLQQQTAESQRNQLRNELRQLQLAVAQHPAEAAARVDALRMQQADLQQRLLEAEDRESYVVTAPIAGVVSALQGKPGETVRAGALLMVVMPADTSFEAELFVPSRAIGFIEPGQRVAIRYQAFPYQRFGLYPGVVASVSETILAPQEVITTVPLAGEPVYRVRVALERHRVSAYGRDYPLQPGMLLEADVELDRRPLWQWLLEPVLRVQGRL